MVNTGFSSNKNSIFMWNTRYNLNTYFFKSLLIYIIHLNLIFNYHIFLYSSFLHLPLILLSLATINFRQYSERHYYQFCVVITITISFHQSSRHLRPTPLLQLVIFFSFLCSYFLSYVCSTATSLVQFFILIFGHQP